MQPRPPPTTAQLALQPHLPSLHGSQSLHALAQAMQNHPEDAEKQLFGVISFAAVCSGADLECKGRAMDAGAFEALLHALRYHSHVPSMQEWVARCFESLPVALWSFIQTLKRDPQDVELQILGGMCLARLHKPECHEAAADAGVCEAFVQAMRLHANDNEVQNAAAIGLRANCRGPTSKPLPPKVANKTTKLALGHGAVDALVEAEDFDVLYNCTLALGSIVRFRAQECRKHAGEIVQVMLRALKSPRQRFQGDICGQDVSQRCSRCFAQPRGNHEFCPCRCRCATLELVVVGRGIFCGYHWSPHCRLSNYLCFACLGLCYAKAPHTHSRADSCSCCTRRHLCRVGLRCTRAAEERCGCWCFASCSPGLGLSDRVRFFVFITLLLLSSMLNQYDTT